MAWAAAKRGEAAPGARVAWTAAERGEAAPGAPADSEGRA